MPIRNTENLSPAVGEMTPSCVLALCLYWMDKESGARWTTAERALRHHKKQSKKA